MEKSHKSLCKMIYFKNFTWSQLLLQRLLFIFLTKIWTREAAVCVFLNFYVQNFARQTRLHQIRKPSPIGIFYQFYNFPMHSLITSSCQLVITSSVNLYPSVSNIYMAETTYILKFLLANVNL